MAQWKLILRRFAITVPVAGPVVICTLLYVLPLVMWLLSLPTTNSSVNITRIYLAQIGTTLSMSLASALGAAFLGSCVAFLAAFSHRRTAKVLAFFMTLPLLVGFVARNYSWTGLLSHFHSGPLSVVGELQDSATGVIVVMSVVFTPFAYFIVSQGTMRLKPEYFASARTLGATDFRAWRFIAVPLVLPSVLVAIGTTFILGLGYFITPQLIGGGNVPFIGNGVVRLLNELGDVAAASRLALALLLTVLAPITVAAGIVLLRRRRKTPKTPPQVGTAREA